MPKEEDFYPAGACHDPRAPYNEKDDYGEEVCDGYLGLTHYQKWSKLNLNEALEWIKNKFPNASLT